MPTKFCECGCGQPTNMIKATNNKRGDTKGEFFKFVSGHQNRKRKQTQEHIAAKKKAMRGHPVSEETRRKISKHHKKAGIHPPVEYQFKSGVTRGKRDTSGNWKGGISFVNGYRCIYFPEHPRAHPNGYVYEHIVIAEAALGRPLRDREVIHHSDGNKLNNAPENICVLSSQSEHINLHRSQGDL